MSRLIGSDRYVTKSLESTPPDYSSAAAARILTSNIEELPPYRRYCEKIKAITFMTKDLPLFDFDNSIKAMNQSKFELLEKYYGNVIPQANKTNVTGAQRKKLELIESLLNEAKKEKSKKDFEVKSETNINFLQFPLFDTEIKYLRFLP